MIQEFFSFAQAYEKAYNYGVPWNPNSRSGVTSERKVQTAECEGTPRKRRRVTAGVLTSKDAGNDS